jgi:hypothetical protein
MNEAKDPGHYHYRDDEGKLRYGYISDLNRKLAAYPKLVEFVRWAESEASDFDASELKEGAIKILRELGEL